MILSRQSIFRLIGVAGRRFYSLDVGSQHSEKTFVDFYDKIFRVGPKKTELILRKNPSLCSESIVLADVQGSFDFLSQAYEHQEILTSPKVLLLNRQTCANRIQVLKECGFKEIRLSRVHRLVSLLNKNITDLKAHGLIDKDRNVAENLVVFLDVPVKLSKDINDTISLKVTRKAIIEQYLINKLGMKQQEVMSLWKTYKNLANRSLQSVVHALHVLENDVGCTKDKVIRNGFLLLSSGDNIKRILEEVPTIAGVPMKELILTDPAIVNNDVERIKETIENLRSLGIPEDRILKCPRILAMKPETVYERIVELKNSKELNVLINDPRVLRLVYRHATANSRVGFLTEMKLKCMSLHVLSNSANAFERHVKSGRDRSSGQETVYFLLQKFNHSEEALRNVLNRHPNWRYVALASVKAVINYLHYKGYTNQELANNILLLIYPVNRVDQKLKALVGWRAEQAALHNQSFSDISNNQLLSLCLYFIESEFHFSGNGVWDADRHDGKQDMVPISIPDFPDTSAKGQTYA